MVDHQRPHAAGSPTTVHFSCTPLLSADHQRSTAAGGPTTVHFSCTSLLSTGQKRKQQQRSATTRPRLADSWPNRGRTVAESWSDRGMPTVGPRFGHNSAATSVEELLFGMVATHRSPTATNPTLVRYVRLHPQCRLRPLHESEWRWCPLPRPRLLHPSRE